MLSKSKNFNHGNVVAQSLGSPAHSIASSVLTRPSHLHITSENLSNETITVSRINPQNNIEEFDKLTGVNSNSPEIIAFSSFIPVYDKNGEFNDFGNYLKKKQDAYLIRASSNISNLLSNPNANVLRTVTKVNATTITDFCKTHAKGIDELLSQFSLIRKKLDFRFNIDKNTLVLIGITPPDEILNDLDSPNFFANTGLLSVEEILHESNDVIKHWTPTKIWMQSCLELKEVLANGMVESFLSEGGILGVDPTNYSYYDSYSITQSRNSFVKKFSFDVKAAAVTISELARVNPETINSSVRALSILFSGGGNSIFSEKIFSDVSNIEESIAKLSHVLCKEYVYSTKLRTDVLSDYGYPFVLGGKNLNVWNYLIGQPGSDITDIVINPLGGGKSLTSLAQSLEPDGVEVLTFEDRFVNDDIGTVRPNVVITPGTIYYLESSINVTNSGFDLTRINRYLTKLNSAINMLKMVKDNLIFMPELPYPDVKSKVLNKTGKGVDRRGGHHQPIYEAIKNINTSTNDETGALSNPINLLRHIEETVLNGSGLLRRKGGPKLWTNKSFFDTEQDVSALLISLALDKDDAELQSLLFMHQIYAYSDSRAVLSDYNPSFSQNVSDSIMKSKIVDLIMDRVMKLLSYNVSNISVKIVDEINVSLSVIKNALLSQKNQQSLKTLYKIGELISRFGQNLDVTDAKSKTNGRFFLEQTTRSVINSNNVRNISSGGGAQADLVTSYSGVQKTVYLSALFKLCCLTVHSANPERISFLKKPNKNQESADKVVVTKVKNAVIGTILDSEQTKQGIRTFSLPETDSGEGGFFDLPDFPNLAPTKQNVPPKKKIKVFELPNSKQGGIKIFDPKNLSKKVIVSNNNSLLTVLQYDESIVKIENLLADYDVKLRKYVDRFYAFTYTLKDEFSKLKNNLQNNRSYGRSLFTISNFIGDSALTRALMTEEQLTLTRCKMEDVLARLDLDTYVSPLRDSTPHFSNLSDQEDVENFLPIEDVHLTSWNLALKDFLKEGKYFEGSGSNKKIISVGIPKKLHRKMRVNSSRLSGLIHRNSLIQLCVYRVNAFLPDVIYKPITFNFDLRLFPTRVLSNYAKNGFSVSGNTGVAVNSKLINLDNLCTDPGNVDSSTSPDKRIVTSNQITDFIPLLKESQDFKFQLINLSNKHLIKENEYSFLSEQQFNEIYKNHSTSFLLEEYLRLVSDLPFDENQYKQYKEINPQVSSGFLKFTSEYFDPTTALNSTSINFFNDETLLSEPNGYIRSIIMPKKFDRVFHMIFDPDDFELDQQKTPIEVIEKYVGKNGDITSLTKNEMDEPTFDKYYVLVKSNEGNDAV